MSDQNLRASIQTVQAPERASERRLPFGPVKVTGTSDATATEIVTAGGSEVLRVEGLCLANTTGSAVTATLHIHSGTATADTVVFTGVSIAANGVERFDDLAMLRPGETLAAYGGAADAIRVTGWATAYL